MHKFNFVLVFLFIFHLGNTQTYQADKISPKAQKQYDKALELISDENYKDAIPFLKEAIRLDPKFVDAYLSLAGVYGELKQYALSVENYEKAKVQDSFYFRYYLLPYSINLAGLGKFNEALRAVTDFLKIEKLGERSIKSAQYRKRCYEFAVQYANQFPEINNILFQPKNLGANINTSNSEYYPSFTINDSNFVFTRRERGIEVFYESFVNATNQWSKAQKINAAINNAAYKGALHISVDGEWLVFAADVPGGFGNYDIYISYLTPTGWSQPENLGPNINTDFWESSPCLSPDKNALYFSSTAPIGYGGSDIYVSYRLPNGKWSEAQNLGPTINTAGDEFSPFMHADNQTLYFMSSGLLGYGGTDLFLTRKGPDGQFSVPENLGYPINTIENEGSLFIAADGTKAFYASDRPEGFGELDLYSFDLTREAIKPIKTLYVKGTVYDAKSKKGLPSSIELIDHTTQKNIALVRTDETGKFLMPLPIGKNYSFIVNRKGYLFYTDIFELVNAKADSTYLKDIPLQPIEVGIAKVAEQVTFEINSAELKAISKIELDKIAQLLQENTSLQLEIGGHTDNTGNETTNQKLSELRAKAVVDYLISKGIAQERLSWKGYGSTQPIADNTSEIGRAKNRRTEFKIIRY